MSRRLRRLALAVFLLLAVTGGAMVGLQTWQRAHRPWRLFRVPPAQPYEHYQAHLGPEGRVLSLTATGLHFVVRETATGATVREVRRVVGVDDCGRLLRVSRRALEAVDPESGLTEKIGGLEGLDLDGRLDLSTRGDAIAAVGSDGWLRVRPVSGRLHGNGPRLEPQPAEPLTSWGRLCFSPGGEWLAATPLDRNHWKARIWKLGTTGPPRTVLGNLLGFTRAGEPVVGPGLVGSVEGAAEAISVVSPDDRSRVVAQALDYVYALSADGRVVAAREARGSGEAVVARSLETGGELRVLPRRAGEKVAALALSPDAGFLATIDQDGVVEVWEIPL